MGLLGHPSAKEMAVPVKQCQVDTVLHDPPHSLKADVASIPVDYNGIMVYLVWIELVLVRLGANE